VDPVPALLPDLPVLLAVGDAVLGVVMPLVGVVADSTRLLDALEEEAKLLLAEPASANPLEDDKIEDWTEELPVLDEPERVVTEPFDCTPVRPGDDAAAADTVDP
jgi:hypothetical protein